MASPGSSANCVIGLIGDFNPALVAHRALPVALRLAGERLGVTVQARWLSTDTLRVPDALEVLDGVWCVPGSPYRDTEAALAAIRCARERKVPYLGTCGGFQHAVLEYARNVLGWQDAAHAELEPRAARLVIAPLACALVEQQGTVKFVPGSKLARAYGVRDYDGRRPDWGALAIDFSGLPDFIMTHLRTGMALQLQWLETVAQRTRAYVAKLPPA